MSKRLLKTPWIQKIIAAIAAFYIWIVWVTTRWTFETHTAPKLYAQQKKGFIICFWHARLFMMAPPWKKFYGPCHMLISDHKDGKLISKTVSFFGIKTIFGSSNRSGQKALKKIVSDLKNGHVVGFTPDGPRGPREDVSLGIVQAAYLSHSPIIPLTYGSTRKKILKTWDRFILPLPFGRGKIIWGDPILPPQNKEEFESVRLRVEQSLNNICAQADRLS